MPDYNDSFEISNPVGTSLANQLDSFIRKGTKSSLAERYEVEHYALTLEDGTEGVPATSNDPAAINAQGRHIPGMIGCLFVGTWAELNIIGNPPDWVNRPGKGAIGYATDRNNFYHYSVDPAGWQILALGADTWILDGTSLVITDDPSGNVVGMNREHQQWVTTKVLTWASTIEYDCDDSNSFSVTILGNSQLGAPLNPKLGATYVWIIKQGAAYTLSFDGTFAFPGGIAPVITPTTGAVDMVSGIYDGTKFLCSILYDIK